MSKKRRGKGKPQQVFRTGLDKVNWTYALGEILLIFIGISLAISFNNWNERRSKRAVELETLKELNEGMEKDLADIKVNIAGHSRRINRYRWIIEKMQKQVAEVDMDTLERIMPGFIGTTSFVTNTAPYEMLKSRGLEIISNDSIRLKLLTYYDITQEWIVENERLHKDHHLEYIKPFLLKYLRYRNQKFEIDQPEVLLQDQDLIPILQWAVRTDSYILGLYRQAAKDAEALIQLLGAEVERLAGY